jgi:hypothetical protein
MFDLIPRGHSPSAVFRQVLEAAPAMTNRQLASLFYDQFSKLDSVAMQHIWYWRSPRRPSGDLSDAELDEALVPLLRSAGYLEGAL